ncbi:NAD(P)-dependent oxidoreductase [Streptomyces sp. NPDC005538]|uniref:NAD(P)-dependent oxidoreductase n=1 Tax=unclassified Streptomyces TaxID=2593676 RepID=UPI0033BA2E6E
MSKHVVVALGPVDTDTVAPVLGERVTFVTDPTPDDLAVAEGAIVRADRHVDADLLARMPRLRVIARTGVGVDLVDVATASARGIPVVVTPNSGSRAVAEGVLAMALHLTKRLNPLTELVREGRWAERASLPVGDLDGATVGIVGYGRIGRRVGELAAVFGMRTLAYDPFSPPPADVACADLDDLVATSDVITLHTPLTDGTRHLVGERLLARVKPGAILVNCGRGGLLDLDATLAALESGRLSGVGLDVFDPEPALYHPLFDHPNVVLTPHLMGMTRRAMTLTFVDAARGVADVLADRPPAAVADPDYNLRKATA